MNEKDTTMILVDNENTFYSRLMIKRGYKVYSIYKNYDNIFYRGIRKFVLKKLRCFRFFFYGTWYKKKNYNTIIIFNLLLDDQIIDDLLNFYKETRIILWNWDPVTDVKNTVVLRNKNIEIWSFDKKDCKKYNLFYNHQFYFKELRIENCFCETDICFVGGDKGRKEKLHKLEESFTKKGLNCKFYILDKKRDLIPYEKILEIYSRSKAILDFIQDGQSGLTLRVMEGIFFGKKIVSNNEDIYQYELPTNLIIPIENVSKDNLNIDIKYDNRPFVDLYDFDHWFNSFFERNKLKI